MPTVSQAPPETLGDVAGRILRLEQPPDAIGLYWAAYSVKHDVVDPVRRWVADETQLYLDADHNVRASSVHRDHSGEMAPVLGQAAVLLAPGANALTAGEGAAARERANIANLPRLGSGLKVDFVKPVRDAAGNIIKEFPTRPMAHGFPDVIDSFASSASSFGLRNGAALYQVEGSLNGVAGRFE